MRDYKFRAWDKKNKKFVFDEFHMIGEVMLFDLLREYSLEKSLELEITQWTGANDKNGKPVYEGDIINVIEGSLYHFRQDISLTGTIYWDNTLSAFRLRTKDGKSHDWCGQEITVEVIGNIFENKPPKKPKTKAALEISEDSNFYDPWYRG